jgi:hypothetical protein
MNGQFQNFCEAFVAHFVDETDEMARFQRFARLLVAEVTSVPGLVRYTELDEEDPIAMLRAAMRPSLEQEGLWVIAPAFFGGVCVDDVDFLLDEVATYVEDPDSYVAPDMWNEEEEEPLIAEEEEANG